MLRVDQYLATISEPVPDVLGADWVSRTITLPPDDEGEVVATLVSTATGPRHDRAVLYIHGYVDYFFNAEHAAHWDEQGYDFYAVDLRKYGRSLRPHQTPNYTTDLRVYGAEIGAALRTIRAEHDDDAGVVLLGHSTGGLVSSLWAHAHPGAVDAVVLNSPWLDHNGSRVEVAVSVPTATAIGRVAPRVRVSELKPYYGHALHVGTGGAWDYDLRWKPHEGFGVYAGWFRAVRQGQLRVHRGLSIEPPVLVCASARSGPADRESPALADSDCVLNVEHMARYGPGLGPDATVARIEGGIHDLALSGPDARAQYEETVFTWLEEKLPR